MHPIMATAIPNKTDTLKGSGIGGKGVRPSDGRHLIKGGWHCIGLEQFQSLHNLRNRVGRSLDAPEKFAIDETAEVVVIEGGDIPLELGQLCGHWGLLHGQGNTDEKEGKNEYQSKPAQ